MFNCFQTLDELANQTALGNDTLRCCSAHQIKAWDAPSHHDFVSLDWRPHGAEDSTPGRTWEPIVYLGYGASPNF